MLLIGFIRQMTHDPEEYKDPFAFNPGRFLGENGQSIERDPYSMVFGFGRRCVANSSAMIDIIKCSTTQNLPRERNRG